jgi:hypothetical protein
LDGVSDDDRLAFFYAAQEIERRLGSSPGPAQAKLRELCSSGVVRSWKESYLIVDRQPQGQAPPELIEPSEWKSREIDLATDGNREYFNALHRQIEDGGAEAMFHDLQRMELGDWHPREIPEAFLRNPALQKQQGHTLPPLEQWYVMLLHNGVIPGALKARPNTAFTHSLLDDARARVPRLRDLTDVGLRNFLVDEESIGVICTKYRQSNANGWTFPLLSEPREAWCQRYGSVSWDNPDAVDWIKK